MNNEHKIPLIPFLLSAIGFLFGCFIMVVGAEQYSNYAYGQTYNTAVHLHVSPGILILIGGIVAILGVVGMAGALLRRS
jgi:hypothetical protein